MSFQFNFYVNKVEGIFDISHKTDMKLVPPLSVYKLPSQFSPFPSLRSFDANKTQTFQKTPLPFLHFFSLSHRPITPDPEMPIEMPRGLPFSVDTFTATSKRKRHHFLTHAHKDHTSGISAHFQFPIYSTRLTKSLLLQHYPKV